MRLLVFSDIHSDAKALEKLLAIDADYYFAAGDLVSWSRGLDKMGEILKQRAGKVYVIPGNHETPGEIAAFCQKWGLHDLHGKSIELGGHHVAGLGCSSPTPFNTPGEYSEAELGRRLEPFAALRPLVMIAHCPPQGTALDCGGPGRHFGSTAVAEFIARAQPAYFFCGHIHEAEGAVERIGPTVAVNVGKRGYLLELG